MTRPPPCIRHALFDLDGVVTDTATVHKRAWRALFDDALAGLPAACGGERAPFTDADYRAYVDGRPRLDGVASFLAARGIDVPLGDADDPPERWTQHGLAARKNALFQATLAAEGVTAFADSLGYLRRLRHANIPCAVVTASRNAEAVLERAGLSTLFNLRVDGHTLASHALAGKPSPASFLFAAAQLGARPASCLLVEDALAGVQAAQAGGFGAILAIHRDAEGRGAGVQALRDAGAHRVVSGLGAVQPRPCSPPEPGVYPW